MLASRLEQSLKWMAFHQLRTLVWRAGYLEVISRRTGYLHSLASGWVRLLLTYRESILLYIQISQAIPRQKRNESCS